MLRNKPANFNACPVGRLKSEDGRFLAIAAFLLLLLPLPACGSPSAQTPDAGIPAAEQTQPDADQEFTQAEALPSVEALPSTSTNPFGDFNPCELLTADEFETVFGDALVPGMGPELIGPYLSCTAYNQGGGKFITVQLVHQTAEAFKAEMESSAEMLDLELTPVEDLGDEAVYYAGLLRVRVGETVLQVLTWADFDQAPGVTRQIAELALPRLP